MLFRATLLLLLTVALNAAAMVPCRVGGMTMDFVLGGKNQSNTHDHQSDCGKSEKRICDAMVQMTAPDQPSVAPALSKNAFVSVVFESSIVSASAIDPSLWRWHPPPDRESRLFKTIYARTGRLLV